MPNTPTIFLSSTFFDLQQIRLDVTAFIEGQLGYRCLASEMHSFPVDPDLDTATNCQRRVQEDADALVLVIGGRYGAISPASVKSITNLEYLTARRKGIPIFSFVKSDVLANLSVWQSNPDADFSSVVDAVNLFQFIQEVRGTHSVWMRQFTHAHEIIDALRIQFAFLMSRGLSLLRQSHAFPEEYAHFTGPALRLSLERPRGWQALLLAQLLQDELTKIADLRLAYDEAVSFGPGERIQDADTFDFMQAALDQGTRIGEGLLRLVNETLAQALAAKHSVQIAKCARVIGWGYRDAIEWAMNLRRVYVHEDWRTVIQEASLFTSDIVKAIAGLPEAIKISVAGATDESGSGEPRIAALEIPLTISNQEGYEKAMAEFRRKRGLAGS